MSFRAIVSGLTLILLATALYWFGALTEAKESIKARPKEYNPKVCTPGPINQDE